MQDSAPRSDTRALNLFGARSWLFVRADRPDRIAKAGVQRLLFGPVDFQLDLQMSGGAEELAHFRAQLVLVSRVVRVAAPIDGPTLEIDDAAAVRAGRAERILSQASRGSPS